MTDTEDVVAAADGVDVEVEGAAALLVQAATFAARLAVMGDDPRDVADWARAARDAATRLKALVEARDDKGAETR